MTTLKKIGSYFYFGIFLIPLIINPLGYDVYASAKLSWFLLFLGLALGYFAWWIANHKRITYFFRRETFGYLLAWGAVLILSTAVSIAPIQSIFGDYQYARGLIFYVLLFIHFLICWQLFAKKKQVQTFFGLIKIVALLLSIHAIGQYFNIDPFLDVDNEEYLVISEGEVSGVFACELAMLTGNPVTHGQWVETVTPELRAQLEQYLNSATGYFLCFGSPIVGDLKASFGDLHIVYRT